jgi:tetratricopeptide (TPR) repeat protein
MEIDDRKRKRLQSCFEHARKVVAQEDCNRDYVADLLSQCVNGDPSNAEYMQAFWENLCKKYNNKRLNKLAQLSGMAGRASMKKAIGQKDWPGAVKQGVELLRKNPWDAVALAGMATVAQENSFGEVELLWLKYALVSEPSDTEVNKQCAHALERRRQYDQAIACWHRIEKARPTDEEAQREIARLALEKTRAAQAGADEGPVAGAGGGGRPGSKEPVLSDEDRLKQQIAKDPKSVPAYMELAQHYTTEERYADAEKVLQKAVQLSSNDPEVQERLDEVQIRILKMRAMGAERQAKSTRSEADVQQYKQAVMDLRLREVEVYKTRSERFPTNLGFKYELGVRYQQTKNYQEAIRQFQAALVDPRMKGICWLAMGECFQQIKQYNLAMKNYAQAVEELPDRDVDNKKLALYRAGKLALHRQDVENAEKYLTALAQLDFGYSDVSALLDKLEEIRKNQSPGGDVKKE